MTNFNESLQFKNLSISNFQNVSITGEVARYNGYSFTGGLVPLRDFNPNTADAGTVRQVLATLIGDLMKPKA